MKIIVFLSLIICSLLSSSCTQTDPTTNEKILVEPSPKQRAREFVDKGGGIFGDIGKSKSGTNFEFASSNVLWRATLKSLDFLPLVNADYSGGVIIYDWYSESINSKDTLKITVRFLNNEVKSNSLQVIAHKKICEEYNKCIIERLDEKFSNEIKENILLTARKLRIEENKK